MFRNVLLIFQLAMVESFPSRLQLFVVFRSELCNEWRNSQEKNTYPIIYCRCLITLISGEIKKNIFNYDDFNQNPWIFVEQNTIKSLFSNFFLQALKCSPRRSQNMINFSGCFWCWCSSTQRNDRRKTTTRKINI